MKVNSYVASFSLESTEKIGHLYFQAWTTVLLSNQPQEMQYIKIVQETHGNLED